MLFTLAEETAVVRSWNIQPESQGLAPVGMVDMILPHYYMLPTRGIPKVVLP